MNNPRVLTDFHHAGLLNSLILLFENRLCGQVFRPIGMEWADEGFWNVYDHPATREQYLGIGANTPDGTQPLNKVLEDAWLTNESGFSIKTYKCQDIDSGKYNRAITLTGFLNMPFDIVIASVPQHVEPFKRLCGLHPNKPKLIFQIGNAWTVEAGLAPNILASAVIDNVPENINFLTYHQEFDLNIFKPIIPSDPSIYLVEDYADNGDTLQPCKNIYSFVNCFNISGHFEKDWKLFNKIEKLMPNWNFKSYGGQCRDGSKNGNEEVANAMKEAKFIWHTKNGGDGYGHVIFNSGAVGRPLITKKEYYKGKLGEKLMVDGETCIAIDDLNPQQIIDKIEYFSEPERYKTMCNNVYVNFRMHVDFDKEAKLVKEFLNKLK
jgi:hypothetical protein